MSFEHGTTRVGQHWFICALYRQKSRSSGPLSEHGCWTVICRVSQSDQALNHNAVWKVKFTQRDHGSSFRAPRRKSQGLITHIRPSPDELRGVVLKILVKMLRPGHFHRIPLSIKRLKYLCGDCKSSEQDYSSQLLLAFAGWLERSSVKTVVCSSSLVRGIGNQCGTQNEHTAWCPHRPPKPFRGTE